MEELLIIWGAIAFEPRALLDDGDSESIGVEVDGHLKGEREEGLWHRALVLGSEAVIQLRVRVLCRVILETDRRPREVLEVVLHLDKELTIIAID